jgi:DNA-binding transcriptional ArsR family regulator
MTNRSQVLDALGDPTRRGIFEALAEGPMPVGVLANRLPISRPAVSQHLRVLKAAGLVLDRPSGTRRLYEIDPAGIGALQAWLASLWTPALLDQHRHVEAETELQRARDFYRSAGATRYVREGEAMRIPRVASSG